MKIVEVTWLDAWTTSDEYTMEEIEAEHKPYVQQAIGLLVKSDRRGVTLAACRSEHNVFNRIMFIPRGMIEKITVLHGR